MIFPRTKTISCIPFLLRWLLKQEALAPKIYSKDFFLQFMTGFCDGTCLRRRVKFSSKDCRILVGEKTGILDFDCALELRKLMFVTVLIPVASQPYRMTDGYKT